MPDKPFWLLAFSILVSKNTILRPMKTIYILRYVSYTTCSYHSYLSSNLHTLLNSGRL